MQKIYCTYIISNKYHTTFYVGFTGNLYLRILQHKSGIGGKFSSRYNLKHLVYYEEYLQVSDAILREKQLKRWHRQWKINLIKELNPDLVDLAKDWYTKEEINNYKIG